MKRGPAGHLARLFINSRLTPLIVFASILLGIGATIILPREEEPQIKVPMIDVFVGLPGASAQEVERRVISPLEKAIYEIDNVEYVYSITQPSGGMIIVRFLVGTDPDQAVVRVHSKVAEIASTLPEGTVPPVVAPRSIDDVPVVAFTLWSNDATAMQVRQVAQELKTELTRHPRVAQVSILGGQKRAVQVQFDRERLASHRVSLLQAYQALAGLNWRLPAGSFASADTETVVEVGSFFRTAEDVQNAVLGVYGGNPVYLRDVATVIDGPDEPAD